MGSISYLNGHFRKMWHIEQSEFCDHLLRLDAPSRHMRFGGQICDEFIEDYAARAFGENCRIWGYFGPRGNLRGTGELKRFDNNSHLAEAAFTVEEDYRGKGIGTQLFHHVVLSARNRDIHHLYLSCLGENQVMQAIARKFEAKLSFDHGDVTCDFIPEQPTTLTRLEEVIEDGSGLVYGVLDIQQRMFG